MNLQWKTVGRDVLVIFLLTAIGGFCIGLVNGTTGSELPIMWLAVSNLIFGTAGFAYSASKTAENRWAHLVAVALGVWILSLMNPLLGLVTISEWMLSIISIFVFMGIGGAIGAAIAKRNKA